MERPPPELFSLWRSCAGVLASHLTERHGLDFLDDTYDYAHGIADLTGGFLAVGDRISSAEASTLQQIDEALPLSLAR